MSGISRSRRWLSAAVCSALVASTVTVGTASAQSSSPALSSGSSVAGSSTGGGAECSATGNDGCTVDNGSVEATVNAWVGHDTVETTLTITGLRGTGEDIAVAYSAEGVENVRATSDDDRVEITRDGDIFSATVIGGLDEDESVTVTITAELVADHEGARPQSLSIVSATQASDALNAIPGLVFAALGIYALIEHAHNMHWLPREFDQLLYRLTGRDPELSRVQWTLF